jgi:hypothetical protein
MNYRTILCAAIRRHKSGPDCGSHRRGVSMSYRLFTRR